MMLMRGGTTDEGLWFLFVTSSERSGYLLEKHMVTFIGVL